MLFRSLTNTAALNYLLRSEIFASEEGQLRAAHLILGYTPKTKDFQPIGNAITFRDRRINRIDVARKDFLAPFDLAPVPHPNPQGIPLLVQPIQQVPLQPAAEGEKVASSTPSLDEQIDQFRFEGETSEEVQILDVDEGTDRQSVVLPKRIIVSDYSSDEDMQSLADLMKSRR